MKALSCIVAPTGTICTNAKTPTFANQCRYANGTKPQPRCFAAQKRRVTVAKHGTGSGFDGTGSGLEWERFRSDAKRAKSATGNRLRGPGRALALNAARLSSGARGARALLKSALIEAATQRSDERLDGGDSLLRGLGLVDHAHDLGADHHAIDPLLGDGARVFRVANAEADHHG